MQQHMIHRNSKPRSTKMMPVRSSMLTVPKSARRKASNDAVCRQEVMKKVLATLIDRQKASNHTKSKTRTRVEHIFGYMTNSIDCMHIKTISILRAVAKIGLSNLTYNMMRCVQLKKHVPNVLLMG